MARNDDSVLGTGLLRALWDASHAPDMPAAVATLRQKVMADHAESEAASDPVVASWASPAQDIRTSVSQLSQRMLAQAGYEPSTTVFAMPERLIDLSQDRLACAILKQWARQPWEPVHEAALKDHLIESGIELKEWLPDAVQTFLACWKALSWTRHSRTAKRHLLRLWKQTLEALFGDFDPVELPF